MKAASVPTRGHCTSLSAVARLLMGLHRICTIASWMKSVLKKTCTSWASRSWAWSPGGGVEKAAMSVWFFLTVSHRPSGGGGGTNLLDSVAAIVIRLPAPFHLPAALIPLNPATGPASWCFMLFSDPKVRSPLPPGFIPAKLPEEGFRLLGPFTIDSETRCRRLRRSGVRFAAVDERSN